LVLRKPKALCTLRVMRFRIRSVGTCQSGLRIALGIKPAINAHDHGHALNQSPISIYIESGRGGVDDHLEPVPRGSGRAR